MSSHISSQNRPVSEAGVARDIAWSRHFNEVGAQPLSEFRFRVLCRSEKLCTAGADTYKPAGLAKTRGGFVVKPMVGVAGVAISAAR